MISVIIVVVIAITFVISLLLVYRILNRVFIDFRRDYWDKLLLYYQELAYENVYTKYVVPFVTSGTVINIANDDSHFLELCQAYLDTLNTLLGRTIYIYYRILGSDDRFREYVLIYLISNLTKEFIDVAKKNAENVEGEL